MTLTAGERTGYERDGYVVRRDVLAPHEIADLRTAAEDVVARVVAQAERPDAGPEMLLAARPAPVVPARGQATAGRARLAARPGPRAALTGLARSGRQA